MLAIAFAAAIQIAMQARAVAPGELVVLTITLPEDRDAVRVRAFDRDMAAWAAGRSTGSSPASREWRALVGVDLDTKPGTYPVSVDAGAGLTASYSLIVAAKKFPTRRLTVDENFVTPPATVQARIDRDAALLASAWAHAAPERLWSLPFVRPVPQPANSRFGTRSIFNGKARNPHGGADFLSPAGTPIHAPNAGRIVIAQDLYFSGNTVVIDHGLGIFSMLAHLSAIGVHEGEMVAADQVIGRVGATGRVTGPHLHWAVRANGARVDPLSVLDLLGASRAQAP
jgi:murein DD-endopeptidase MepM/ murein hydrolase activator NlpD